MSIINLQYLLLTYSTATHVNIWSNLNLRRVPVIFAHEFTS